MSSDIAKCSSPLPHRQVKQGEEIASGFRNHVSKVLPVVPSLLKETMARGEGKLRGCLKPCLSLLLIYQPEFKLNMPQKAKNVVSEQGRLSVTSTRIIGIC